MNQRGKKNPNKGLQDLKWVKDGWKCIFFPPMLSQLIFLQDKRQKQHKFLQMHTIPPPLTLEPRLANADAWV